jgi:hypothetical protein
LTQSTLAEKLHHDTGHIGWEAMNKGR